jgi:Bor protein
MSTEKRFRIRSVLAFWPMLATGCYTTTLHSGKPAAPAGIEYDEKWHHGLVWGIAELSGPYNLARVCPRGWASIKTETSFLNGIVGAVTGDIYSPQTVTVRCSTLAPVTVPVPSLGAPPNSTPPLEAAPP